jgi:hypothetical protein
VQVRVKPGPAETIRGEELIMTRKTILIGLALFMLVVGYSQVALAENSTFNMPMLREGIGARALAMGGAYVAVANDATAGYWNPAALSEIEKVSFASMIAANMAEDRKHNYLAIAGKFEFGAIGFSWLNSGTSDIVEYDASNTEVGEFGYNDHVFLFSYGNALEKLQFGMNFKVVHSRADASDNYSATGVGFDAGVKFAINEMVHLGVTASDLGTKVGGDNVPANFRIGAAMFPVEGFIIPLDIEKTQNVSELKLRVGAEYSYQFADEYFAAMRAGVNDGEFAIGAGLTIMTRYSIDYAYVSERSDAFGENHRISVSANW